jgi:hemolysin activation/secretion protein
VLALCVGSLGWPHATAQILRPESEHRLAEATRLFVRAYRFEGNTVFPSAELAKLTAPYANRHITAEELELARRAVSLHYVQHGYINSGAVIPDQDPADGTVLIRIVEGVLTETQLHGTRWLRDRHIKGQLRRWSEGPLNIPRLQEGLQILRQDPNVQQINAEVRPGTAPGESLLDLRVEDRQPFRLGLQIDNQRPPSVGSEQLWLLASDLNLTGHSDPLELRYGVANSDANGYEFSQLSVPAHVLRHDARP